MNELSATVKSLRKQFNMTQEELSLKSGVGLRFVRDLEQGKSTLRLDKVNQLAMKRANIYYKNVLAGVLTEGDDGYEFYYLPKYLTSDEAKPVTLTMPLRKEVYKSNVLFPFFDGLIPEGWLLDVALRNTDISMLDRMSLLLLCCRDCIGAVSVEPVIEEESTNG